MGRMHESKLGVAWCSEGSWGSKEILRQYARRRGACVPVIQPSRIRDEIFKEMCLNLLHSNTDDGMMMG